MSDRTDPFHSGERDVQARVGVAADAALLRRIVASEISSAVRRFLATQRMAVAASLDAAGRPWASLLTGPAGFIEALEDRLLRVAVAPSIGDPLAANLHARPELALLILDPRTRQRVRLNGRALLRSEGVFLLTEQVYGNCPKYIQKRRLAAVAVAPEAAPQRSWRLDARQRSWIACADTLFVASFHPEGGADASHRGGNPGFVRLRDERHLAFTDYPGNNMFNTLGNFSGYPRAGLLFVDFASGDLLQLTGRVEVRLEPERDVVFEIEEALETKGGSPLRWELVEYSLANPPVTPTALAASQGQGGGGMTKQIACNDVVEGCSFKASAATEEELLREVTAHAAEKHGVKEVTPELAARVKAAIQTR